MARIQNNSVHIATSAGMYHREVDETAKRELVNGHADRIPCKLNKSFDVDYCVPHSVFASLNQCIHFELIFSLPVLYYLLPCIRTYCLPTRAPKRAKLLYKQMARVIRNIAVLTNLILDRSERISYTRRTHFLPVNLEQ